MKNALLWISIIPVSILCSFLIPIVYEKIVGLVISPESWASTYISTYAASFFQGILFVVPSYFLAPKYKKQTALIMVFLCAIFMITGQILYSKYTGAEMVYIPITISIIGAILAYINLSLDSD